jgi:transglutaminase-like putative cysteine protease
MLGRMKSAPLTPALPLAPLVAMCTALGLLALPLWDHAASWAVVVFILSLLARLLLGYFAVSLPPAWLKLSILTAALAIIYASYGTLAGVESAFGALLILIGLKVTETNHARDLQVLTLLGCFLGLCDLFFEQDFERWLYVGAAYVLCLAARIYFYQPDVRKGFRRSLGQTTRIVLQAVPLTILFFIFFPRFTGEFKVFFGGGLSGVSGLPEKLSPGSLASLALRNDVAFTVSFPDNNMPLARDLYWRGLVLWDGTGLNWERGGPVRRERKPKDLDGPVIRQHIMLEPYGDTWLFALDRPASALRNAVYESGGVLHREAKFYTRIGYDVESRPQSRQAVLPADEEAAASRTPIRISPAVQELAESLRYNAPNDLAVVQRGLNFFRVSGFVYSLSPGTYASPELDEFLFKRRVGFCEHYAAAFASLMRLAGVPSRVVIGYQGGEYNEIGHYVIVRQSDAHAWCEVHLEGRGWQRVDPTSVIAPDRVNAGLQGYLETSDSAKGPIAGAVSSAVWRDLQRRARLYWSNLSYQWNLRVLSFDRDTQRSFFAAVGFINFSDYNLATVLMLGTVLILGGLLVWLRRTPPAALGDPAHRWYARYCRRLASAGLVRRPAEGPLGFAERAAAFYPPLAPAFREVGRLYAGLRYSARPPRMREFIRAIRQIPRNLPSDGNSPSAPL